MVSRLPVLQDGFVEVGERREDGLEIFEVAAGPTHPANRGRWAVL